MTKFSVEFGEVCTVNDSQGDLFFSEKQISDPLIFDPNICSARQRQCPTLQTFSFPEGLDMCRKMG